MTRDSLLRRSALTGLLVALGLSAGCAGTATQAPAAATSASVPSATATPLYDGRYESDCAVLDEAGLFFNDVIDLRTEGRIVRATYRKLFYGQAGCPDASRMVTVSLPEATWSLDDQVTLNGETVDRVTVTLQTGKLMADIAPGAKATETADEIVLVFGKGSRIPVTRLTEGSVDKDLRRVTADKLYIGDAESPKQDGYPTALDTGLVFTRVKPSK